MSIKGFHYTQFQIKDTEAEICVTIFDDVKNSYISEYVLLFIIVSVLKSMFLMSASFGLHVTGNIIETGTYIMHMTE